eukprot:8885036-Pyramimonas_sp.AAC.1
MAQAVWVFAGAASLAFRGPRRRRENTPLLSLRPTLITQTHSSLRPTHHSDSLITQTHSSLRLSHDSDSSLITPTHSSFRLTHHSDSL